LILFLSDPEGDAMPTLTIADKTTAGRDVHTFTLDFLTERMTVREIIRSRVYEEVQLYNAKQSDYFRGLVQPTDAEATLNGYKLRQRRKIDWEEQYARALKGFTTNGYFILVDNRQVEELDEVVELCYDTQVSFIKLIPLVGG
jgi:hypothetical protein